MRGKCKRGITLLLTLTLLVPGNMAYASESGEESGILSVSMNEAEQQTTVSETGEIQQEEAEIEEAPSGSGEAGTEKNSEETEDTAEPEQDSVSGNTSVSGNQPEPETPAAGDSVSENEPDQTLSGNGVSENSVSKNSISVNRLLSVEKSVDLIMNEKGVYQISTPEQLDAFRCIVNHNLTVNYDSVTVNGEVVNADLLYDAAADAELLNDLDLSSMCGSNLNGKKVLWMPIGLYVEGNEKYLGYQGNFEGNDYTIKNLYSASGPFADITGGNVSNLSVSNMEIIFIDSYVEMLTAGGICGTLYSGTISNCKVISGSITASGQSTYAGGICGRQEGGTIENCVNEGVSVTVKYPKGGSGAGGICGKQAGGTIKNCVNRSETIIDNMAAGGICGVQEGPEEKERIIENCVNEADIRFQSLTAGGICGVQRAEYVGMQSDRGVIRNCINKGNCENKGNGTSWKEDMRLGGICGEIMTALVENCINAGNLSAGTTGGISATQGSKYDDPKGAVRNCLNLGSVAGAYAGGITSSYVFDYMQVDEYQDQNCDFRNCYFLSDQGINSGISAFFSHDEYNPDTGKDFPDDAQDLPGKGERRSIPELASGSAAYALQSGNTDQTWGQGLLGEKDPYPVLTPDVSKRVYKVTFINPYKTEENGIVSSSYGNTGSTVTLPDAPAEQVPDKVFTGWYVNGVQFTENTTVGTADLTVTAGFGEILTITQEDVAGVENNGAKAYDGIALIPVTVTLKDGKVFRAVAKAGTAAAGAYTAYELGSFASVDPTVGIAADTAMAINKNDQNADFRITIDKAEIAPLKGMLGVGRGISASYQYALKNLLPELSGPKEYGEVTYQVLTVKNTDAPLLASTDPAASGYPSIAGGILTVPVNAVEAAEKTAAITIGIQSGNYRVLDASLTVSTGYRISFESCGGSNVPLQYAPLGGLLTVPEEPVRKDFRFLGWYQDSSLTEKWEFASDTVPGDMVLYAKWGFLFDAGIMADEVPGQTYTGSALKPELKVKDGETLLTPGIDYTLSYSNNTRANVDSLGNPLTDAKGKEVPVPKVIIKGKGNYKNKGTTSVTFSIYPCSIEDTEAFALTGKEYYIESPKVDGTVSSSLKLLYGKKTLSSKSDYSIAFYRGMEPAESNRVDALREAGDYTVLVTGKGNFTGTRSMVIHVSHSKAKLLEKAAVKLEYASAPYTGGQLTPGVESVKLSNVLLEAGKDYTVVYGENKEAGNGTVTIKAAQGSTAYAGEKTVAFKITGTQISRAKLEGFLAKAVYTGSEIKQDTLTLSVKSGTGAAAATTELKKDIDYTVSYNANVDAGKAGMLITGMGQYTGSVKKTYSITRPNLGSAEQGLQFTASSQTGRAEQNRAGAVLKDIRVAYTPKDNHTGKAMPPVRLQEGRDYTVTYQNNKNAGRASAFITGKGNYSGKLKAPVLFDITAKELASADITVMVTDCFFKKIQEYKPAVTLYDNGKKLAAGKDFKVTGYSNNKEVTDGALVIIEAGTNGCYSGKREQSFRIYEKEIKSCRVVLEETVTYYDGMQKAPVVKSVMIGGQELPKDQYTVCYGENVKKGTGTVLITGKGQYGGKKEVKFMILPKWLQELIVK